MKSIAKILIRDATFLFIPFEIGRLFGLATCQVLSSPLWLAAISLYSATLESSLRRVSSQKTVSCISLAQWGPMSLIEQSLSGDTISPGLTQLALDVVGGIIFPTAHELHKEGGKHETQIKNLMKRAFCGKGGYWVLGSPPAMSTVHRLLSWGRNFTDSWREGPFCP